MTVVEGSNGKTMTVKLKPADELGFVCRLKKDLRRNYKMYLLTIPVILYYILFCYKPMYGAIIAFKEYNPAEGIYGSPWVGLDQFQKFFANPDFLRILSWETNKPENVISKEI